MPTPGTQRVAIRIEPDLWERFGEQAKPDRSTVLRDFMEWYVNQPERVTYRRPDPKPAASAES